MERRPLLLLLLLMMMMRKQHFVEGQSQPTLGPGVGQGKDIKKQWQEELVALETAAGQVHHQS